MRRRLLVIESADDIREQARTALELEDGLEVIVAEGGRQGVHMAERQQPDAILLDVMMPDIDGPRIVRELRANPSTRDIPVIFLIAQDAGTQPSGEGVLGALRKPLDPDRLRDQVKTLLGW